MTPPGWHQYSPTMACTLPRDASHLPLVPGGPGHSSRVRASRGRGTARPSVLSRDIKELSKCARNVPCLTSARRHVSGLRRIRGVSRPVGRVLCARLREAAVIHLGLPLPTASCGLPASIGRATLDRSRRELRSPLDLAPGGVYLAAAVTCGAGGLLHHRFTLTPALPRRRSVFCGTIPRVAPGRRYRPPCPVEPGPSSPGLRPARPPGRLTHSSGYADGAPPRGN